MTYITGSITNANPGPTLYTAIEASLTAAGFVFVDTVVISTHTHKIWRSPAASNLYNKDWYLDVSYPTTGTSGNGFNVRAFEYFDAATDLARGGPVWSSGQIGDDYTFYGSAGAHALETNWYNWGGCPVTASAFTYWFSITTNRVIFMLSNQNTRLNYAGYFETNEAFEEQAGEHNFPLTSLYLQPSGSSAMSSIPFTRIPIPSIDQARFTYEGDLSNAWVGNVGISAEEYDMIAVNFPAGTPTVFGCALAWDCEVFIYRIGFIGRLLDVVQTRGNTSSAQAIGDTANVTTNGDLTGGDEYVTTHRATSVMMFRGI